MQLFLTQYNKLQLYNLVCVLCVHAITILEQGLASFVSKDHITIL